MAAIIAWLVVYTWKYCDVRGHVGAIGIGREREALVRQEACCDPLNYSNCSQASSRLCLLA